MITQAMKKWFHKLFAWWPWKQSPTAENQHVTGAMSGVAPETSLWLAHEESSSQAGATYRRSGRENWAERSGPPLVDGLGPSRAISPYQAGTGLSSPPAPTPRQRLEFLRYLVQRGLINEGIEEQPPDSSF